jgi:hypothetical protein
MIKLELSVDDVNMILRTLGKHPFEEVVRLIENIKSQGDPQVEVLVKKMQEEQAAAQAELPQV